MRHMFYTYTDNFIRDNVGILFSPNFRCNCYSVYTKICLHTGNGEARWDCRHIFRKGTDSHVIRSVLPAGSRRPAVSYDWLACGTWLKNSHACMCMSVTYDWRSVFLYFGTGSLRLGLGLGLGASESFIASHCRQRQGNPGVSDW